MDDINREKKYILIKSIEDVRRLIRLKDRLPNLVIIALESVVVKELKDQGFIIYKESKDYLPRSQYHDVNMEAIKLAKSWYKFNEKNIPVEALKHEEICLGNLLFREFSFYFVEVFKEVLLLKRIIELERPSSIILFNNKPIQAKEIGPSQCEDFYIESAKLLSRLYAVNVEIIGQDTATANHSKQKIWVDKKSLKIFLQLFLFYIYFKFYRLYRFIARNKKSAILFFIPWNYIDLAVRELRVNHRFRIVFVQKAPHLSKTFVKEKITQICLSNYIDNDIRRRSDNAAKKLREKWSILRENNIFKDSFQFQRISLWEIVNQRFDFLFGNHFINVIERLELIKKVIKTEKVSLVVLSNDLATAYRAVALMAKQMRIRSLVIQHGLVGDVDNSADIISDKMAVWGKAHKERWIELGVEKEKLVITGCPRYDRYYRVFNVKKEREIINNVLNLNGYKGIFVLPVESGEGFYDFKYFLGPSYSYKDTDKFLSAIFKAMYEFPEKVLIVKNKPQDKYGPLAKNLAKKMGLKNVLVTEDIDLFHLLPACELLISSQSTVILEALIVGKPVVTVNLRDTKDIFPFAEKGLAIGVYKAEDIPLAIRMALEDCYAREKLFNARKKLLYDYSFGQDGESSKRVARLMESMIDRDFIRKG